MIGFGSFAPISTKIFIADGNGNNAKPLLSDSDQDQNASLSHDGQWVIFSSRRNGSTDIYRVRRDGTDLERLVDHPAFDDQANLSPDGKQLAFVSTRSGQADIWILELATRKLRQLTKHPAGDFRPSWSPDGEWIAFSSDRDSPQLRWRFALMHSFDAYVIRADGSEVKRVTTTSQGVAGCPSWSADGKQLVVYQASLEETGKINREAIVPELRATTQIVTVDLDTLQQQIVTSGDGKKRWPQWLCDRRIAFANENSHDDSGVEFSDGSKGTRGVYESPHWTPDGRQMVFHRSNHSDWPPLRKWHSRDARFKLMRTGIYPAFSPNADRLVVNNRHAGKLKNDIVAMNLDGSERSTLFSDPTLNALQPVWSPQGDRIAFALGAFFQKRKPSPRAADIAVIGADGTDLQLLTSGDGNYGFPSWSPDGSELVYRSFSHTTPGLCIINVETRETRLLIEGPHNFPAWSPAGDRIAFTSNQDGDYEIYSIRSDGSDLKCLTNTPGNDAHLSWSPDGKWIAFSSERAGFRDETALSWWNGQSYGDIFVMRADGTDVRQLTDDQYEEATPSWMPSTLNNQ